MQAYTILALASLISHTLISLSVVIAVTILVSQHELDPSFAVGALLAATGVQAAAATGANIMGRMPPKTDNGTQ